MGGFSDPPSGFSGSHTDLKDVASSQHHDRPKPGNNVTEDANGNFNVATRTNAEIREQALAYDFIGL